MRLLEDVKREQAWNNVFKLVECPHCHKQLMIPTTEINRTPVSTNAVELIYSAKCCNCGHILHFNTEEYTNLPVVDHNGNDFYKPHFELSDTEWKKAKEFMEEHRDCHRDIALTQQFIFVFTVSTLGVETVIKCANCGKQRDISDYEHFNN